MRKAVLSVIALASVFVWLACDSQPTQPVDLGPSFLISDGAQNGGNGNFFWLPPLVSPPTTSGTFMGTLSPTIKICKLSDCGGQYWEIKRTSGPAEHRVGVDVKGQHYHVNWDIKDPVFDALESEVTYRISVWLGGLELGFADVQFGISQNDVRYLQDDTMIPLNDGRILPIKFRIEYGVLGDFDFELAYHSNREANTEGCPYNHDVFLYDGTRKVSVNITSSPNTLDGTPSWHPDGMKIAFASNQSSECSTPNIFVLDLETGIVDQLTTDGGWKPAWSPNGDKIAFQKGWPPEPPEGTPEGSPLGRQHDIWVMDANGGNKTQWTDDPHAVNEDPYEDIDPTWHPFRPGHVAWARSDNDPFGDCPEPGSPFPVPGEPLVTCSFDIVLSNKIDFFNNFTADRNIDQLSPAFAHGVWRLVYAQRSGGDDESELWLLEPGSGRIQLTFSGGVNQEADWSPDNLQLVFSSGSNSGELDLWVMDPKTPGSQSLLLQDASWGRWRPIVP